MQLLTNKPAVVALYVLNPLESLIQDEASSTTGPENVGDMDPVVPTDPILNTVLIEFAFCALRPLQHRSTTTILITCRVYRCNRCTIVVV